MDAATYSPLLQLQRAPAEPSSGWGHAKLVDRRLAHVWSRLARLKKVRVTVPMVVKEFFWWRIAPLQRHSRPMWAFTGSKDPMRLQVPALPSKTLRTVLELLTGDPAPATLPEEGCLLYQCSNKEDFVKERPLFDEWGLRLVGLEGPRENPIFVTPMLVDPATCAPDVDAGGERHRVLPGRPLGERMSLGAPEIAVLEVPASAPEVVAGELVRPGAPEAAAPEAPANAPEMAVCGPVAKGHAPTLGSLRLNLGALRKRKGLWSCSGDAYRPQE